MNAKHSPSTGKCLLTLLGLVIFAQLSPAQEAWREGRNIAGLAREAAPTGQTASALIGGKFTSGGFRAPSDGSTLWTGLAQASAEARFEDLFLTGNFGFELTRGNEMMGSMFTHPGYYPVDILEFTPGVKLRQTYDIGGGMAWKNASRWTPGATIRFQGTNYAKRKDLRHTTYRQELEVVPSVAYSGDGWTAGLSYVFSKTSEFITAEQVGQAKAESYTAFLDKGLLFGTLQAWDGSGVHLKEAGVDRFPVKEFTHGVALQASLGKVLYADVEYDWTRGEAGEKGYIWFRFPGARCSASLVGTLSGSSGIHRLKASWEWTKQENYETVLEKVTEGGVTTPVEYGSNRIWQRRTLDFSPSYRFVHQKGWSAGALLDVEYDKYRITCMYPYVYRHEPLYLRGMLHGEVPVGAFLIRGAAQFCAAVAQNDASETVADESLGVSSTPFRLSEWWAMEQEWQDAPRLALSLELRYNFLVGRNVPLYVEAGCQFTQAFRITALPGSRRQTTHLTIGYSF